MKIKLKDYEKYLEELTDIINKLEDSETDLNDSVILYNRGLELYKGLKDLLENEKGKLEIFIDGKFEES